MELAGYLDNIEKDIYCHTYIHHKPPEKIFISSALLNRIIVDINRIGFNQYGVYSCCGVPVQVYYSCDLEYYLSASSFKFNE